MTLSLTNWIPPLLAWPPAARPEGARSALGAERRCPGSPKQARQSLPCLIPSPCPAQLKDKALPAANRRLLRAPGWLLRALPDAVLARPISSEIEP